MLCSEDNLLIMKSFRTATLVSSHQMAPLHPIVYDQICLPILPNIHFNIIAYNCSISLVFLLRKITVSKCEIALEWKPNPSNPSQQMQFRELMHADIFPKHFCYWHKLSNWFRKQLRLDSIKNKLCSSHLLPNGKFPISQSSDTEERFGDSIKKIPLWKWL